MISHRWLALSLVSFSLLSAGQLPERDRRNTEIRHTDMKFTMPEYRRLGQWKQRAEFLRKQILSSAGLLPLPEKTPLHPQVFDKTTRDDYSIEKVLLETHPGFFLGGNLYRPLGKPGPHPAVVSPHGHWTYGRLENSETGSVPARGIHLAKQGYVVFTYDMIGYTDTVQLPHGFETAREQLWSIGILGLQLWNSIRAVDFVSSLPEVDPNRIAATGASGGGTQTFLLAAVDERIRYAAPVNMVSAIMQGGSVCENAANLRIDTFNVEIAALMAPRPMLMVSATGDWTRNTPHDEFPAVQSIYRLFDAEQAVENIHVDAPHNYNKDSREAVYAFFGKRILNDDNPARFREKSYRVEQLSKMMTLWGRELPRDAVTREGLISYLVGQAEMRTNALLPSDSASLAKTREEFREGLEFSLLASLPSPNELASDRLDSLPNGEVLVIGRRGQGDRIPAVVLRPRRPNPSVAPTLIVHPEGTAWVLSSAESIDGVIRQLLGRGGAVMGIDAFQTGRAKATRDIASAGRNAERYFTTFNRTDDANRVQDILTALTYARTRLNSLDINLVGMDIAGVWSVFARALADERVYLMADLANFDARSDAEFENRFFIPGIRKNGDFRAASLLLPPGKTLLYHAAPTFPSDWTRAAFQAAGVPGMLEIRTGGFTEQELLDRIAPTPARRRRR